MTAGDRYSLILDRTQSMVSEWQHGHVQPPRLWRVAAPFGWTEDPRLQWRVSGDVRDDLMVVFDGDLAWRDESLTHGAELLYGLPLTVDSILPPNSVILEPRAEPASMVAKPDSATHGHA